MSNFHQKVRYYDNIIIYLHEIIVAPWNIFENVDYFGHLYFVLYNIYSVFMTVLYYALFLY